MTLEFDSLSLRNFGPYLAVQDLDLRPSERSPVILIHGENTLGKTQLFSALRWCLYGTFLPQQTAAEAGPQVASKFNKKALRAGEAEMAVTLHFTANGEQYTLTRIADSASGAIRVRADLRIGATVIPQGSIGEEIGKLLHPQISEFFMFDGELMQDFYERLSERRERDLIRTSIDQVLGVPALQLASEDVRVLASDSSQRQLRATRGVRDSERLRKEVAALEDRMSSASRDRIALERLIAESLAKLDGVKARVKAVAGLQADAHDQEMYEAQLASAVTGEQRLRADMAGLVSTGWISPLAQKLSELVFQIEAENSRANAKQRTIGEARARVLVLEEQVDGGACPSCGRALPPPGVDTLAQLADARELLGQMEGDGASVDLGRERRIRALVDFETVRRYAEKQAALVEIRALQYHRRQALAEIRDRLKGHSVAGIRALGQEQESLEKAIARARLDLSARGMDLQRQSGELEKARKSLDRLPGAQPRLAVESAFYSYVEELLHATILDFRESTRAEVESAATSMFARLVHDADSYGGLRIGSDYHVDVLDPRGQVRETSEGGRLLVALSLIGALKQSAVRGGPVVLDSPLGRLDLKHRENVLKKWVPTLGTQAVLLVQSGELTVGDARTIFGPLIAHQYRIVRPGSDPEEAIIERVI